MGYRYDGPPDSGDMFNGERTCLACGERKRMTAFALRAASPGRTKRYRCRTCRNCQQAKWKNPLDCAATDCQRPRIAHKLCRLHYGRWRNGLTIPVEDFPVSAVTEERPSCAIDSCNRPAVKSKSWCNPHYQRVLRHGHPQVGKPIGRRGVDKYIDSYGYVMMLAKDHPNASKNGSVAEHVKVMAETVGRPLRQGETVHHRNAVRHDNRPENLELWSKRHPAGARVADQIRWALEIVETYGDDPTMWEEGEMAPKLLITRGLPGSGKTTLARAWVAEDPVRRARVNRDDFRAMLHDSVFVKQSADAAGTEKTVMAARDAAISALLKRGVDVICDDTCLPQRVARDLRRLAVLAGASFDVIDLTDVLAETCIERDAARTGRAHVGERVIRDMHTRYVRGKAYPLPMPEEPAEASSGVVPYAPPAGAPKAVMVDIDGTVALMCNRSPYDETRVHEDRPNDAVIAAVRAMHAAGHAVIFCSGRTDACRPATEKWLAEHVAVPYEALHMRAAGDMRRDSVVKREIFDREIRHAYNVVCVFDDRAQVVAAWREIGLTVFAVAEGNF